MPELVAAKPREVDVDVTSPGAGDCDRTRYMKDGRLLCQLRECLCGAISHEGLLPACAWCEQCDSSPAIGPDDHTQRVPHQYTVRGSTEMHCAFCGAAEK